MPFEPRRKEARLYDHLLVESRPGTDDAWLTRRFSVRVCSVLISRTNDKVSIFGIAFIIIHRIMMTSEKWLRASAEKNREYGRPGPPEEQW
jgi:hypothetical protein